MKVALVLPPAEVISEKKDTPTYQHVGLGYLAAVLKKQGIDVSIVDAKLDRLDFSQTIKRITDLRPALIGITAMTHEIKMAAALAEEIKKVSPNTFIALGGVHVTTLPVETLKKNKAFDIGVLGESEKLLPELVRMVEIGGHDFSGLSGIAFRKGSEIVLSGASGKIEELDELPFPSWELFPNATDYIIVTSRGCPYSCIFCMQASGKRVRRRSAASVVAEMENALLLKKPNRFMFFDETFALDKKRVHEICDLLIKKGLNNRIKWSATTRVDSVDKELLQKMKDAGCDHIEFGVESGNEEILKKIKKGITIEQAVNAVKIAKDLKLHTETGFIIGHPDETAETAYQTIYLASRLNTNYVQLGIMVPYPGTEVAEMAKNGLGGYKLLSYDWSDYNKQLGNALELKNLSRKDLERIQFAGYLKLFVFNRRYKDLFRFLLDFHREAFAFIRNYFRKGKASLPSNVKLSLMLKMIFSKSPTLNTKACLPAG
jgi:radical SAM superfamily enzyme YgiQ (UPF0313 family)